MEARAKLFGTKSGGGKGTPAAETNSGAIDEKPRSVYELMTRMMLEEMREDVREVKSRVNTLLWLVVGALLVEMLMRVVK